MLGLKLEGQMAKTAQAWLFAPAIFGLIFQSAEALRSSTNSRKESFNEEE